MTLLLNIFELESITTMLFFILAVVVAFNNSLLNLKFIKSDRTISAFFCLSLVTAAFVLLSCFPGAISIDDRVAINSISSKQVTIWTSFIYGHLLSAFKLIGLEFGGIIILNFLLYSALLIKIFSQLINISNKKRRIIYALFISALAIWPIQLSNLALHNRDSLFSLIAGHLFYSVIEFKQNYLQKKSQVSLIVFLLLFMLIRKDGMLIGTAILFYLSFYKKVTYKLKISLILIITSTLFFINSRSQLQPSWAPMSIQYNLVPYLVTLSAILNSDELKLNNEQASKLSEYYILSEIKKLKKENWYEITRGQCLKKNNLKEPDLEFYKTLVNIYLENSKTVIEHYKIKTLKTFLNYSTQGVELQNKIETTKVDNVFSTIRAKLFAYRNSSNFMKFGEIELNYLTFSLCICFVCMILLKKMQVLLLFFNLRLVIILFFAPDPQSRYLVSAQILMLILMPLLFLLFENRQDRLNIEPELN